jgi:hypothetical protein
MSALFLKNLKSKGFGFPSENKESLSYNLPRKPLQRLFCGRNSGGIGLSLLLGFVSFFSFLLLAYLFAPGLREGVEAGYLSKVPDFSEAEGEKKRLLRERDLLRKAYLGTLQSCSYEDGEAEISQDSALPGPLTVMEVAELEELEAQDKWRVAIPDEKPAPAPVKRQEPQRRPAAAPAPTPKAPAPEPAEPEAIPKPKPVPPSEPSAPGPKKAPRIPPMAFPADGAR